MKACVLKGETNACIPRSSAKNLTHASSHMVPFPSPQFLVVTSDSTNYCSTDLPRAKSSRSTEQSDYLQKSPEENRHGQERSRSSSPSSELRKSSGKACRFRNIPSPSVPFLQFTVSVDDDASWASADFF